MNFKRIILFAGHYGSGKTNIAINCAKALRRTGETVTVADLDIVNPYFRTKDSAADLRAEGIDLVVSDFANSNVDFPALPKEIYALVAPISHSEQSNNSPRRDGHRRRRPRRAGARTVCPRHQGRGRL